MGVAKSDVASRANSGKIDLSLLPAAALEEEARVWEFGAQKYSRDNWRKLWGSDTPRVVLASSLRHMLRMLEGEMLDSESGLAHAAHVRCNMAMLIQYLRNQTETK